MYDVLTSAALFVVLTPGVLLTLPPGGGLAAALVHAVVFYVVQTFLPSYVPSWGVLIIAVAVVGLKAWSARSAATASVY